MSKQRIVQVLLLLVVLATPGWTERKKPRAGRVSMQQRMRQLEAKLSDTQADLSAQQRLIDSLQAKLGAVSSNSRARGPGPGYSVPEGRERLEAQPNCPLRAEGFKHIKELRSCYRLVDRNILANWTEAVSICKRLSSKSHLLSIESEAEQEYMQKLLLIERGIGSLSRFWTSGRRQIGTGMWMWEATEKLLTYQYWIQTSVHNDDRFSCLAVYSAEAYNWGDVACWAEHQVVCEISL